MRPLRPLAPFLLQVATKLPVLFRSLFQTASFERTLEETPRHLLGKFANMYEYEQQT